jgi:hypothetical protein
VNHVAYGFFTVWVQLWVQPNGGEWLPVSCKRHQPSFRELNLTRYSEKEFRDKIRAGNHFLKSVIKDKFVTLIGSLDT